MAATKSAEGATSVVNDPRWAAVVRRDAQADESFVFSVDSTGVYCRPSCPARRARPENVRFHGNGDEAKRAGFRPCKRCRPDGPPLAQTHMKLVTGACRAIERAETPPKLDELAAAAGMSPFHFHRVFRRVTGLTPKQYATAQRREAVQEQLGSAETVTEAIYAAGYGSNGRFYAEAGEALGMTPGAFRKGGARQTIRFAVGECSLGSVLVAQSERGVCAILLGDDPETLAHDLQDRFPRAELLGDDPAFEGLVGEVIGLVENPRAGASAALASLPLDVRGTAFQQRVWEALRAIPAGTTTTYARLAEAIGAPKAVRAVGAAVGANPVAVAIPCHRVIRTDGAIGGYRWGVERKRALMARELASPTAT